MGPESSGEREAQTEIRTLRFSGERVRLDAWLAAQQPDLSRARIQSLIREGLIVVDGAAAKPSHILKEGERVSITIPPPAATELSPQDIPLDILHEDHDILAINKPAGLVVHPAPGHESGTLVNALLHHCKDLQGIGGELRPGIVHRLDKDTSGVLVVAKNESALRGLQAQFKSRETRKTYMAIAWGCPEPRAGTIDTLIGRSTHDRKKMSARPKSGRKAVTHYRVVERFAEASLLSVRIETGRTHQIRVHLAHIGHPIVGDSQYGRARTTRRPISAKRQMLHAESLALRHPRTGLELEFNAPLPADMRELVQLLRGEQ